jgi:hypothetical protein
MPDLTFHEANDDSETLVTIESDAVPNVGDTITIAENTEAPRVFKVVGSTWRIQGKKLRSLFVAVVEVRL